MVEKYIVDFVSICAFISKNRPEQICKSYIYEEPERLRKMMDKTPFAETAAKLRVWRNLSWLDCDAERLTKSITVEGKKRRVFVLNRAVFEQLKALFDAERGEG